jgi:hypothetical protein
MERPYSEAQVFELEIASQDIARLLHNGWSPTFSYRRFDEDVLEAIVYDAMIALREAMLAEEYE